MKALVCHQFGHPAKLAIESVQLDALGDKAVLIDVKAAGLNLSDTLILQGGYPLKPALPFVPGVECAGIVRQLGKGVTGLAVGDRVIATVSVGAFAQQCIASKHEVLNLPANMSFEQGAGFCIRYGAAYHAFKQRAKLQSGETVLVIAGEKGLDVWAVQIAKAMGAEVIALCRHDGQIEQAHGAGAHLAIDGNQEDLREQIKMITKGKGVDVIFDPVGDAQTQDVFRSLAWGGRYLVAGVAAGHTAKIPMHLPMLKAADILGVHWSSWAMRDPKANQLNFSQLLAMVECQQLIPQVSALFPLQDFQQAFQCLLSQGEHSKVVLIMD